MIFKQAIDARVAQLPCRIGDICDALGWSRSAWGAAKGRANLSFLTLQRIALVLGVDVAILATRNVDQVCAQPVPDWRWLDAFRVEQQSAKHPLDWRQFQRQFRERYSWK